MNVCVLRGERNLGVGGVRNKALRRAHGRFIHFMDSDDLINIDFYRALYDFAVNSGADMAVASYLHQRPPKSSIVFDNALVVL